MYFLRFGSKKAVIVIRSEDKRRFTRHRSVGELKKRREIVVPGPSQKRVKQATKKGIEKLS